MDFSGKELVKGEPDASSFPSGGLRATFEARGYTAWDPTSPAFIKDTTLYIPTAFCSYSGEALDKKTPLLRSMEALSKEACKVLRLLGKSDVTGVSTTVGPEQEYFLIDKHNEVAPSQHELAPVFDTANVAVDHNQLTMEMMKEVADRHGYVCLLHEKPFDGINGSGKHNNWSMITNTGANLLEPGRTPAENTQFLVFLTAVIKAVDEYADLLRLSVASAGNDHRLGANEAPPAIVSMFLGDELTEVLDAIEKGTFFDSKQRIAMDTGAAVLPHFFKDTTDRNRTSPFAFTGNKFEFRMLGSSISVAGPNIVLNTAVAEALSQFYEILKDVPADEMDAAVRKLVKDTVIAHKRIVFNGNGYTDEWVAEAEKRGLYNLKSTPEALPVFKAEKNVKLFTSHHIFTETEIFSRYEILLENYVKTIHIEAKTLYSMVEQQFMPALLHYTDTLSSSIAEKKAVADLPCTAETALLKDMSAAYESLYTLSEKLAADTAEAEGLTDSAKASFFYHDTIIKDMDDIRAVADKAEVKLPKEFLPYPSYEEMLFYV